jgi:hypothetical protein
MKNRLSKIAIVLVVIVLVMENNIVGASKYSLTRSIL